MVPIMPGTTPGAENGSMPRRSSRGIVYDETITEMEKAIRTMEVIKSFLTMIEVCRWGAETTGCPHCRGPGILFQVPDLGSRNSYCRWINDRIAAVKFQPGIELNHREGLFHGRVPSGRIEDHGILGGKGLQPLIVDQ